MSNDLPLALLSAAPSLPGLLILHFAAHTGAIDRRELNSWKGVVLFLIGVILIALPLFIWSAFSLQQHPAGTPHAPPIEILGLAVYLAVIFLWFIWIANGFTFEFPESYDNPWEEHWGGSYSPELKQRLLSSVMEQLDRTGKIGNLVVDVGCGATPISQLLPSAAGRKFILIDIAGHNGSSRDAQSIRLDVEKIMRPDSLSYGKALVRVCRFLETDPRSQSREKQATAMLFSDILNYVDFRGVISCFAEFLKTEGRMIIVNLPTRGITTQFSEKGLKNNGDLCRFLQEHQLEIEYKDFPCRPEGESDESVEMIVLVSRKLGDVPPRIGGIS